MLTRVVGTHWHALVCDVLALGRRAHDMFTDRLTFAELVSMVMAPAPRGSLYEARTGGWSRTDHLIANLQESNAGLAELPARYDRPGAEQQQDDADKTFGADAFESDELDALLAANYALGPSEEVG